MIRRILLLLLLLGFYSTSITAQTPFNEAMQHTLLHDETQRTYYLYEPSTDITQILMVLHPPGSNGRAMQFVTGLNALANEHGIAIVYPDAGNYFWNDGRIAAGLLPDTGDLDDTGFLLTLADTLREEFQVESVSVTGIDNGGTMALHLACEAPNQFDNVIPVAAVMWEYHVEQCPDAQASTNLLFIMGEEHPNFIPDGEDLTYLSTNQTFVWLGWQATVDFWRDRNQCPESDALVADNSLTIYSDCADDTSVTFWKIEKAGYNWARMGDNSINRFGVDASDVIINYLTDNAWQSLTEPDGIATLLARSWILYVPSSYDPTTPAPLVLNLHGRLSNASMQAYTSDFNAIAEREGIIMLYPNGINTEWNYLLGLYEAGRDSHSDEAFIRALLDDIDQELNIDRTRMYVTGLSNGGFMTQRLACTMQDQFTAFAAVAATAPFGINQFCEDKLPVPMMYIHGTADQIVPWTGSIVQDAGGTSFYISYSMEDSFNFWGIHNACSPEHSNETLTPVDPETQTEIITFTECENGVSTMIYIVNGGGHVWHGTRTTEYDLLGENSQDFNASEEIWAFFSQYQQATD